MPLLPDTSSDLKGLVRRLEAMGNQGIAEVSKGWGAAPFTSEASLKESMPSISEKWKGNN